MAPVYAVRESPPARRYVLQEPVHRAAGHPQLAGDSSRAEAIAGEFLDAHPIEARSAAPVHALPLRQRDPFQLTLAADVGLEGREDGQHAVKSAACRR